MTTQNAAGESSLAGLVSELPGFEVLPHLVRLIARGQPVALEALAASAGLPVADVERMLRDQPGTDWESDGRLVGFGLTQRTTAHRFVVSGQSLYTWCASDALFFPAVLGEAVVVESACPTSGRLIRIELAPHAVLSIDPPDAVVTDLHDSQLCGDVRTEICDQGHFFGSREAARDWATAHPDGRVLTVAEAFQRAVRGCRELGWLAPERSAR